MAFLKRYLRSSFRERVFAGIEVTNSELAKLQTLENVLGLHLNGCPVSDAGLACIERLPNLDSLNNLYKAWIGSPKITTAGVAELKGRLPGALIYKMGNVRVIP